MKFGIRKPSPMKSFKARTTGRLTRQFKRTFIPGYGQKGVGWIKNPKRAAYNAIYNRTSVSLSSLLGGSSTKRTSTSFRNLIGASMSNIGAHTGQEFTRVVMGMDVASGSIYFQYGDGTRITDPSLIRRIKATPEFKVEKERLELSRQVKINEVLEQQEKDTDNLINLHKNAPNVSSLSVFEKKLKDLEPDVYERKKFTIDPPTKTDVRDYLRTESLKQIKTIAFWKLKSLREQYINDNYAPLMAAALESWEEEKASFEEAENVEEERQNLIFYNEYEQEKLSLQKVISGNPEYITLLVDNWIEECVFPIEVKISHDYQADIGTFLMNIYLTGIGVIPDTEYVRLESGNIKEKNKTQTKIRQEYGTLVFSLSVFIAANIFNLSPVIKNIILSVCTQQRDSEGNTRDDYILSVKFLRTPFEMKDIRLVDPVEFCMQFENRCNMTSTMLFKPIKPY